MYQLCCQLQIHHQPAAQSEEKCKASFTFTTPTHHSCSTDTSHNVLQAVQIYFAFNRESVTV